MDMRHYDTMLWEYTCIKCGEIFHTKHVWLAPNYYEVVCTICGARTRFVYSEDLRGSRPELVIPKAENPEAEVGKIEWVAQKG